jgi:hypothetical protein
MTSPKPFPLFAGLFSLVRFLDAELMAREKKPDQGYFPLDDSLIRDGCPKMRSTYPQTTFAPSLQRLNVTDVYW